MKTVFWEDGVLRAKDQKALPYKLDVMYLDTVDKICNEILTMGIRGGPAIGVSGAFAVAMAVRESGAKTVEEALEYLDRESVKIANVRPTAYNLSWAVGRIMKYAHEAGAGSVDELYDKLVARAQLISDDEVRISYNIAVNGASVIPAEGLNIITHCNTGPLCAIEYGVQMGAAILAHQQGKKVHVYTDETRPRLQGLKLNAYELREAGVPYTVLCDNMAGYAMREGLIDMAFVGADRLAANGDMAAKIGVYGLSVLAQAHGIPVYGFATMSAIDFTIASGDEIKIEQRDPQEVLNINGCQIAPEDTPVLNPAFDITPSRYFVGIITDEGIAYPPFKASLAALKEKHDKRIAELEGRA